MNSRKRPVIHRIRTLHRWLSLVFIAIATALIVDVLMHETASDALSFAALVGLVLLLLSGGWLALHHYRTAGRARRRGAPAVASPTVSD